MEYTVNFSFLVEADDEGAAAVIAFRQFRGMSNPIALVTEGEGDLDGTPIAITTNDTARSV